MLIFRPISHPSPNANYEDIYICIFLPPLGPMPNTKLSDLNANDFHTDILSSHPPPKKHR